jgi:antitoxin component YwqK of YwqJK toxin-antitoxin module
MDIKNIINSELLFKSMAYIKYLLVLIVLVGCNHTLKREKIIYDKNGKLMCIKHFNEAGILEGQYVEFYPNGNVSRFFSFNNAKIYGNAFYFYEDGAISSHRFYNDDTLDGYATNYFDDTVGIVKTVYLFEMGKLIDKREHDSLTIGPNKK